MNLNLKGSRALVCGSSQGIGKAAAHELASLGATICLMARSEEKLKEVKQELETEFGEKVDYLVADFSSPTSVKRALQGYEKKSEINILVNNTGGPPGGPIAEADLSSFEEAFTMHLKCNHVLVQELLAGMKAAEFGRIINVISTSVKIPLAGLGVSNTIRGAVASWSKTMANELGKFNITVNNVLPGATNTVRLTSIAESKAAKTGKSVDEVLAGMASAVPMQRVGEAHEVAAAIAFLASPAAAYINGVSLAVDGGRTGAL